MHTMSGKRDEREKEKKYAKHKSSRVRFSNLVIAARFALHEVVKASLGKGRV